MWPTITATVHPRDWTATDRLGNHVERYASPLQAHVLVAPGATNDLGANRPEGVRVDLTLHFTKAWSNPAALRGAKIALPAPWAGTYKVVGSPEAYMPDLVPGTLYLPVEVQRYDG